LLTGPLAVTAYQTIIPMRQRSHPEKKSTLRPAIIGTCHAYAPDSKIVERLWPQFYEQQEKINK
jgi:hypothetical protein